MLDLTKSTRRTRILGQFVLKMNRGNVKTIVISYTYLNNVTFQRHFFRKYLLLNQRWVSPSPTCCHKTQNTPQNLQSRPRRNLPCQWPQNLQCRRPNLRWRTLTSTHRPAAELELCGRNLRARWPLARRITALPGEHIQPGVYRESR